MSWVFCLLFTIRELLVTFLFPMHNVLDYASRHYRPSMEINIWHCCFENSSKFIEIPKWNCIVLGEFSYYTFWNHIALKFIKKSVQFSEVLMLMGCNFISPLALKPAFTYLSFHYLQHFSISSHPLWISSFLTLFPIPW